MARGRPYKFAHFGRGLNTADGVFGLREGYGIAALLLVTGIAVVAAPDAVPGLTVPGAHMPGAMH